MGDSGWLGNGKEDLRDVCLRNVLQHVPRLRSQLIKDLVMDALKDAKTAVVPALTPLSTSNNLLIKDAVFLHKGILIKNKTLIDTVQPRIK